MTDIPEDIRAKAETLAREWAGNANAIAEALMAERERAASICDVEARKSREEAKDMGDAKNYATANHWNAHADGCEECAQLIRSPDTATPQGEVR